MNQSVIFLLAAVIIIGGLLFALMSLTKKGAKQLDVERYRLKWLVIEQHLIREEVSSYSLSVLNADKLLDQALTQLGIKGKTMAERMKSATQQFRSREALWKAHKLRNRIAHDSDVKVTYDDARYALAAFKQALKDVGAI